MNKLLILAALLLIATPAHSQVILLGDCWGQTSTGQHAKAEAMVLDSTTGNFTMSGTMDYMPRGAQYDHLNQVYHWTAHGTLTPGALPYEWSLYLHYDEQGALKCNRNAGGVFACQFGTLSPQVAGDGGEMVDVSHQENHDCYGDPAVKLVCVQERANDAPNHAQSPAEHTIWTPLR